MPRGNEPKLFSRRPKLDRIQGRLDGKAIDAALAEPGQRVDDQGLDPIGVRGLDSLQADR